MELYCIQNQIFTATNGYFKTFSRAESNMGATPKDIENFFQKIDINIVNQIMMEMVNKPFGVYSQDIDKARNSIAKEVLYLIKDLV
jgi:hypothetical protein